MAARAGEERSGKEVSKEGRAVDVRVAKVIAHKTNAVLVLAVLITATGEKEYGKRLL